MEPHPTDPAGPVRLELDDIQSGVLHERPSPYVGTYLLVRIDEPAAGRDLVRRLLPLVDAGPPSLDPAHGAWITVGFTYRVCRPSACPKTRSTASPPSSAKGWRLVRITWATWGRAARSTREKPLGTGEVHVAVAAISPDAERLEAVLERARGALDQVPGVTVIWRQDCYQLPTGRTSFGFKDGIGQPAVEGSGLPPSNTRSSP